jgi:type IV pilus assembly protein PilA
MQQIMEKSYGRMQKRRKLGNKGFSLVELIIVIAIMAALIAILAPQLIRYVESSRQGADLSSANSILASFRAAVIDPANAINSGFIAVTWNTFSGDIGVAAPSAAPSAITAHGGAGPIALTAMSATITAAQRVGNDLFNVIGPNVTARSSAARGAAAGNHITFVYDGTQNTFTAWASLTTNARTNLFEGIQSMTGFSATPSVTAG